MQVPLGCARIFRQQEDLLEAECKHVLVIGAANLDIKGQPEEELVRGSSVPGRIRSSLGGVARNVAENLARLDVETVLLTAVGDDETGERILGHAVGLGVDISPSLIIKGRRSGAYLALLAQEGSMLDIAMDDMSIMKELTADVLEANQELFRDACLVTVDANLSAPALAKVVDLCDRYDVALCADPTSTTLTWRVEPHLSNLYMIAPNAAEAAVLTGMTFDPNDRDAAQKAADRLVSMGVELAIITLGEFGVVYSDGDTAGHIPAVQTQIVDPTGAGDAMTAAIIFGLLEDIPLDECVRLGITAATLTLRTRETVRPDLSVDLLYDELVV